MTHQADSLETLPYWMRMAGLLIEPLIGSVLAKRCRDYLIIAGAKDELHAHRMYASWMDHLSDWRSSDEQLLEALDQVTIILAFYSKIRDDAWEAQEQAEEDDDQYKLQLEDYKATAGSDLWPDCDYYSEIVFSTRQILTRLLDEIPPPAT